MSRLSEMKDLLDYTFYKMESDVVGFDEKLEKFKEELPMEYAVELNSLMKNYF